MEQKRIQDRIQDRIQNRCSRKQTGQGNAHLCLLGPLSDVCGMTLMEVIVTMALVAIFMTAAMTALLGGMQVFQRMQNTTYAITVSDTLLDKIAGELTAATKTVQDTNQEIILGTLSGTTGASEAQGSLAVSGTPAISFCRRDGTHIYITRGAMESGTSLDEGGQLLIHYYPVRVGNESSEARYNATDWTFDEAVYHGLTLSGLTFTQVGTGTNVIQVTLTLSGANEFSYEAVRYVECTNYVGDDLQKIKTEVNAGSIPIDDDLVAVEE